jgi:hypothetical protein
MCFIFYQTVFVIPAEVVVELEPVGVAAESRWSRRRRCDRPEAGSCRTSEGAWLWLIVCELKSKKQKVKIFCFCLLFGGLGVHPRICLLELKLKGQKINRLPTPNSLIIFDDVS